MIAPSPPPPLFPRSLQVKGLRHRSAEPPGFCVKACVSPKARSPGRSGHLTPLTQQTQGGTTGEVRLHVFKQPLSSLFLVSNKREEKKEVGFLRSSADTKADTRPTQGWHADTNRGFQV